MEMFASEMGTTPLTPFAFLTFAIVAAEIGVGETTMMSAESSGVLRGPGGGTACAGSSGVPVDVDGAEVVAAALVEWPGDVVLLGDGFGSPVPQADRVTDAARLS